MGTLYIVATPIGNLKDITWRALEVLKEVDLILCEDTRHTSLLLNNYEIKKPLLSFHEHNEVRRISEILTRLKNDENIALVSDAGTPLISDPGFKLVRAARENGIEVKPIPGPNAAIAAISSSGLPTDKFFFIGYLPKTSGKRETLLNNLLAVQRLIPTSFIFYESPFRVDKTLSEILKFFPDSQVSVQRELTKVHETVLTGTIHEVKEKLSGKPHKGEFSIVLH